MMRWLLAAVLMAGVAADVYMHNPRGSNNRLNERSANRRNADRMFDSQNNNRGGYNVGDATNQAAGNNQNNQYRMKHFFSGPFKTMQNDAGKSFLTVEWTNQHGCGGNEDDDPQKQNCNLVLQYMCQDDVSTNAGGQDSLRDGGNTQRQDYQQPQRQETQGQRNNRRTNSVRTDRGLNEPFDWYDSCYFRERNKGLFTADQKIGNTKRLGYSSAIRTRQNPNGNRRGYECPEERDYFPYWHPTPWKDIAVLAENASMCSHYQSKSFNVQPYGECVEFFSGNNRKPSRWNNKAECEANEGTWVVFHNYLEKAPEFNNEGACNRATKAGLRYLWAVPYDATNVNQKECLVQLDAPDCMEAPWSRSNHLGNGLDGQALNYTWTLPHFPSGDDKRCVLRLRYNISTDDYDPYNTNASHNEGMMQMSPVQQNPYVELGTGPTPLRLAVNTAQFGRVFQDRSHVFELKPRPNTVAATARLYNLNVRGKRGNIVQVYPAVEYDFFPTTLPMRQGDLVHIQWTGSNSHNNGNPAGDGQAGDAGEGQGGTDRHNMVQMADLLDNFPMPFERTDLWSKAEVKWIYHDRTNVSPQDLAVNMASSGFFECVEGCTRRAKNGQNLNNLLNNAPASYEGAVLEIQRGTYHYTCTRNNNFSNRSQKGSIIVQ